MRPCSGAPIDMDFAQETLADLLRARSAGSPSRRSSAGGRPLQDPADRDELARRAREVARPRQIAMYCPSS
jgi:chromosomal replication initiator protein